MNMKKIISIVKLLGLYLLTGVDIIEKIFNNNEFVSSAFAFKMLFTCVAVAAGFKGGEIVPTLFIGAAFGALAGTLLVFRLHFQPLFV